jgi:hypothetical protein
MSRLQDGWDAALSAWAHGRDDIRALVQIGSRAQKGGAVDSWSDYDYQLITTRPERYGDGSFCRALGPCWAVGAHEAFGNCVKVTAVYEGALEADFVVLRHLEVLIATAALRWPKTELLWPRILRRGVSDLRIVVAPGWKVIKGGAPWEARYSRIAPYRAAMTEKEFEGLCGNFWAQLVWAAKKAARGEFRASQRGIHEHLIETGLRMLQEEALLSGRQAYPLGRRAELWLTREQLEGTAFGTRPDPAALMNALEKIAGVFLGTSAAVAAAKGWRHDEYAEVRAWLAGSMSAISTGKAPR